MSNEYFFVTPTFARGAASVIDLAGGLRTGDFLMSPDEDAADARAHAVDRRAVMKDFARARDLFLDLVSKNGK